jgi:processive 1,2-diacylglycerol beta-glucosyltransferase
LAKQRKKLSFRLFGIVTDYIVHPVWCYRGVDCYFVAHSDLVNQISESRTIASGIPVGKKFYDLPAKTLKEIPHILVMAGGLGLGSSATVLQHLKNISFPIEITFVAGKNKFLYQQLLKLCDAAAHKYHVYEFCSNIYELMGKADLLVTKAGGLTTSEAMVTRLPMVIFDPIPGIETQNAQFLAQNKVAIWVRQEETLAPTIQKLFFSKTSKLQEMRNACSGFYTSNAGQAIVKYIEESADE